MINSTTNWHKGGLTCVIMCGGNSSRFGSFGKHKSLAPIAGQPVLSHVIEYWKPFAKNFIFVVKLGRQHIEDFVATQNLDARFVEPASLGGIADGLLYVEPLISGPFILVLGDCYCAGNFDFSHPFDYGIGVAPDSNPEAIQRSYAVFVEGRKVTYVEEDPITVKNDLCGMGHYFFQPDVMDYIRQTPVSAKSGELEITDTLQTMINAGVDLRPVYLDGKYVNINTPEDLQDLENYLVSGNMAGSS